MCIYHRTLKFEETLVRDDGFQLLFQVRTLPLIAPLLKFNMILLVILPLPPKKKTQIPSLLPIFPIWWISLSKPRNLGVFSFTWLSCKWQWHGYHHNHWWLLEHSVLLHLHICLQLTLPAPWGHQLFQILFIAWCLIHTRYSLIVKWRIP